MAFSWRQLGAFVQTAGNVLDSHLDGFAAAGGKWLVPVLVNDQSVAADNRQRLADLKERCAKRGIIVGLWANGFGEDPLELASQVVALAKGRSLWPVVFDLEASYKDENAPKLPATLSYARDLMPTRPIGVSSYGYADRAMIWNGRTLDPPRSLYDLRVRWLPQHYYLYDGKYAADWAMADLKANGATDGNIADPDAPGGRGIPLSYAHGTLEVTGVEGHDLATGLAQLRAAKAYGFSYGFSIYVLERTSDADFALLAAERGRLFK